MPAVSVIVPSYNHARFLGRRLRSVLDQTFRDIEVLVIDDASTDGSWQVLQPFTSDPRVRLERGHVNSGSPFAQWNAGVSRTTAPLVWIAESDDDADPRLLDALVSRLDAHPACGLAFAQSLCIDAEDHEHGTMAQWTDSVDRSHWLTDYVNSGQQECAHYLAISNTIPNASAVVFRRRVFERAGGAPAQMRVAGDWMTWLSMLLVSDVAFVAEPLNRHRSHETTVRASLATDPRWWQEALEVWRFALTRLDLPAATRTRIVDIVREVVVRLLTGRPSHLRVVRGLFGLGCRLDPNFPRSLARLVATRSLDSVRARLALP